MGAGEPTPPGGPAVELRADQPAGAARTPPADGEASPTLSTLATLSTLLAKARAALAGRYTKLEPIGLGTNGLVVLAMPATGPHEPVALKIALDLPDDAPATQRFLAECAVGQRLRHEHIVPISVLHESGGLRWFEMPDLGRERLDVLLRSGNPPRERALEILQAIASALEHAHHQGVVHGALRPSRVHLTPGGNVVVTGFLLRAGMPARGALAPGSVGDPAYMPPEQRHDQRTPEGATDLYALAVIASELLLGARPVTHGRSGMAEVSDDLRPFRPHHQAATDGAAATERVVREAIRRAMLPDPGLRFPTALAFVHALARVPLGAHAHPQASVPPPSWRRTAGRRLLLLLLVVAALVVIRPLVRAVALRAFGDAFTAAGAPPR